MKKQKSQFGSAHLLAAFALLIFLFGILIFVFWSNIQKSNKPTSVDTDTVQTINKKPITDNTSTENDSNINSYEFKTYVDINDATGTINGAYNLIIKKYNTKSTSVKFSESDAIAPYYKPNGRDYYISSGKGVQISVSNPNATKDFSNQWGIFINPIISDIKNYFVINKFEEITNDDIYGYGVQDTTYYSSKSVTCSHSNINSSPYYLSCANIADFVAVSDTAEPLIKAFRASQPSIKINVFGMPSISNSTTPGYQIAGMTTANAHGLFYKKDGESWKYFKSTQAVLPCSDYNTAELKLAFYSAKCFDNSGDTYFESTVK